jgi:phosphate transport system permease protein
VPVGYREAALALGIARWKTIVHIVVKTASRGSSREFCSPSRASAAKPHRFFSPHSATGFGITDLSEPIAALPLQIFTYAISPYDDWHRQAWAGALVLVTAFFALMYW